jgi:mRNA interferase MazF
MASRGEVWGANLSPAQGHEQAGTRPVLVISDDRLNHGPANLVVVLPITSKDRRVPLHVEVEPPDGGLGVTSYVMCDQIRTISTDRLIERWGRITSRATLSRIEDGLRIVLNLQ